MDKLNLDKKSIKSFSISASIALAIIATILFFKGKSVYLNFYIASITVLFISLINANLLKPLYIVLMRLAHIIAWINTRLILTIIFYLIFTPIGLILKIFGKDLLDRKIEKNKVSYWHLIENKEIKTTDFERQF